MIPAREFVSFCIYAHFGHDMIRKKSLGGNPVLGKSILVVPEGGFGDLVMHSRYLKALLAEGAHTVYVETSEAASGIFRDEPSIIEIRDTKAALQQVDFITWNFDLYARYQPNPFFVDPDWRIALFPRLPNLSTGAQALIEPGRHKYRVGLLSTSTSTVRHEPFRSIPCDALVPLFDAFRDTEVQFYCLNKGGRCEIDPQMMTEYGIANLGPEIKSFAETAAVLGQLDLVISIDSGPAHLAAALDRPVWLLLSDACDSRWYDCRHCTPWYESMRLYRQDSLGDWTQPIENVIAALQRIRSTR